MGRYRDVGGAAPFDKKQNMINNKLEINNYL